MSTDATERHCHALMNFFKADPPMLTETTDLSEALYTISELRLWPDQVDTVSCEQALLCWKIIEKLRTAEFPDSLRI